MSIKISINGAEIKNPIFRFIVLVGVLVFGFVIFALLFFLLLPVVWFLLFTAIAFIAVLIAAMPRVMSQYYLIKQDKGPDESPKI